MSCDSQTAILVVASGFLGPIFKVGKGEVKYQPSQCANRVGRFDEKAVIVHFPNAPTLPIPLGFSAVY